MAISRSVSGHTHVQYRDVEVTPWLNVTDSSQPVYHPIPGVQIGGHYYLLPEYYNQTNEFRRGIAITAIGRDNLLVEVVQGTDSNILYKEIMLSKNVFLKEYLHG